MYMRVIIIILIMIIIVTILHLLSRNVVTVCVSYYNCADYLFLTGGVCRGRQP